MQMAINQQTKVREFENLKKLTIRQTKFCITEIVAKQDGYL